MDLNKPCWIQISLAILCQFVWELNFDSFLSSFSCWHHHHHFHCPSLCLVYCQMITGQEKSPKRPFCLPAIFFNFFNHCLLVNHHFPLGYFVCSVLSWVVSLSRLLVTSLWCFHRSQLQDSSASVHTASVPSSILLSIPIVLSVMESWLLSRFTTKLCLCSLTAVGQRTCNIIIWFWPRLAYPTRISHQPPLFWIPFVKALHC